jgi:hypothetical protein
MKAAVVCAVAALFAAAAARAAEPAVAPARFAIIVGVNQSVDRDARPLRYADDDAAAYLELFRTLGGRTYLVSRLDEGTRRLHSQAVAEAQDPRRAELERVLDQVAADVGRARARGVPTVVYFVYAGHGNVEDGRGYLALEDARLYGADLERLVVAGVGARETHFIVDACYSAFLAFGRGPGGERREAHGFSTMGGLASHPGVGLLLSTSSARESHEWSEFQAGVFSHEVRSGLLGAADADGDGQVSYREIASFVDRANSPIPNERFRPDVYAKEPRGAAALLDLRPALGRRLEVDGGLPGHYFIEDARGVRLADFHTARGQAVRVIRLAAHGTTFLRRADAEVEYVMDAAPDVLRLRDLRAQPTTAAPRGAANESFRLVFSLPFSQQVVDSFVVAPPALALRDETPRAQPYRRPLAIALAGVGVAAAAGGTWALLSAMEAQEKRSSQRDVIQLNETIARRNDLARVLFGVSGAALATSALVWFWPRLTGGQEAPSIALVPTTGGGAVSWTRSF